MYIKLFGALLILSSGSSIGWIMANMYSSRVKELKELQLALSILETEISYGRTILPEALKQTAAILSQSLADLFYKTGEELKDSKKQSFDEIWLNRIEKYKSKSYLLKEDLEILKNWGHQLGCSDLENQINVNQLAIKRLEQHEKIASEIARKKVKVLRYAGVLISLMLIIIFY